MLTGDFAFYSPNYSDILVGICTEPLPQLRAKAPWVPEGVEHWFQRACAKEPLERFQSADEMIEALRAAAGTSPLSKHQSVPEGRIAPETLVGYATPAVTALQPDASPLSLARTQAPKWWCSLRHLLRAWPRSAPALATRRRSRRVIAPLCPSRSMRRRVAATIGRPATRCRRNAT
jgi:hypothetical protein